MAEMIRRVRSAIATTYYWINSGTLRVRVTTPRMDTGHCIGKIKRHGMNFNVKNILNKNSVSTSKYNFGKFFVS